MTHEAFAVMSHEFSVVGGDGRLIGDRSQPVGAAMAGTFRVALAGNQNPLARADDGWQVHAGEFVGVDATLFDQHLITHLRAVLGHRIGHANKLGQQFHQSL
ncbi:hypothetical protein D3C76_1572380 [compost metagenome]